MDIFEYIDRVKANFDKQPEPRYNMKKYFMGGSVTTPKRGLVDEPGSYSQDPKFDPEMTLPELKKAGIKSKVKYKYFGKDGKPVYAYSGRVLDKNNRPTLPVKLKTFTFKSNAAREKFIKNREKIALENVGKSFKEVVAKRDVVQNNVNNWIEDWFNKNNKKFKLGQYDEAMSKLKEDWAKENIKDKYKVVGRRVDTGAQIQTRTLTSPKGFPVFKDIKLEGMTGTDPARIGLTKPLALGRTMDTTEPFYKKSFHNFILKNDPELRKGVKSFMTWATQDKRGLGKQSLLLEASNTWLKNNDVVNFMGEVDDLVLDKKKRGEILRKYFPKTTDSYMNKIYKIDNFRRQTISKLEKLAGVESGYINYNLRKDTRDIRKILNVDKLPLALRYSGDHIIGLKEAELLKDKNVAKQVIDNVVGKTFQQNIELGGARFGRQRRNLTKEFVNKKTTPGRKVEIVNLLNEMSEKYMPGELKYSLGNKNNLVIKNLKPQQLTQADRFKSYFEQIDKTKQGKQLIKKEYGSLRNLIKAIGCPNNKAMGGRIGFEDGANCFEKGDKVIQSGKPAKGAQFRNFAKLGQILAKTGKTAAGAADILLSVGAGAKGLGVGLLLETGFAMEQASKGQPGLGFSQTVLGDIYNAVMPDEKEINLENRLLKSAKTEEERVGLQNLIDFNKDQREFAKKAKRFDYLYNAPEFEREGVDLQKLEDELYEMYANLQDRTPKIMNKEISNILEDVSYRVADEGRDKLKGFYGKIFGDRQLKDKSMDRNVLAESYFTAMAPQVSDVIGIPMFANPGKIQSTQQQLGLLTSYEATPQELDDIYDMGRLGASSGGIASGPPPEKGPQSQGLAYLMKNGKR